MDIILVVAEVLQQLIDREERVQIEGIEMV